jgi:hypothetical protein
MMNDNQESIPQSMHLEAFISDIESEIALADEYINNDARMSFRKSSEILLHILRKIMFLETNKEILEVPQTKKPGLEIVYSKVRNEIDIKIDALVPFIIKHNRMLFEDSTYSISSEIAKTASESVKQVLIYFKEKYAGDIHIPSIPPPIDPTPKNYKKLLLWFTVMLSCLFLILIGYNRNSLIEYIKKITNNEPIIYQDCKDCKEVIEKIDNLEDNKLKKLFWINYCIIQIGEPDHETMKKICELFNEKKVQHPDYEQYSILFDLFLIISIYHNNNDLQTAQDAYEQFKANCKRTSFCGSQFFDHFNSKKIEKLSSSILEYAPQGNDPFQFFDVIKR